VHRAVKPINRKNSVPPALPLRKPFLIFLAPMMLSNILQSLFGTINNVYLGQMIGVDALARRAFTCWSGASGRSSV
jgi:Na+-driven multidrug efflux pump